MAMFPFIHCLDYLDDTFSEQSVVLIHAYSTRRFVEGYSGPLFSCTGNLGSADVYPAGNPQDGWWANETTILSTLNPGTVHHGYVCYVESWKDQTESGINIPFTNVYAAVKPTGTVTPPYYPAPYVVRQGGRPSFFFGKEWLGSYHVGYSSGTSITLHSPTYNNYYSVFVVGSVYSPWNTARREFINIRDIRLPIGTTQLSIYAENNHIFMRRKIESAVASHPHVPYSMPPPDAQKNILVPNTAPFVFWIATTPHGFYSGINDAPEVFTADASLMDNKSVRMDISRFGFAIQNAFISEILIYKNTNASHRAAVIADQMAAFNIPIVPP